MMKRIRKVIIFVVFNLIVTVLIFLVFEGFSSTVYVAYRIYKNSKPLAESLHTGYDEQLGWANLPDVYIENMYGPGIYLKTNGQLFRSNRDFDLRIPEDKVRVICSGDSFAFGYGVDNDHTWCQLLVSIDGRLESVNMGQGGYGVDQAYLWYKRDGTKLEHDVHVFAFITDDFRRMQDDGFLGYAKPYLELQDGVLVTRNVPVPESPSRVAWLDRQRPMVNELRSIKLLNRLLFQKDSGSGANNDDQVGTRTQEIALKVLQDLKQLNETKNSVLVLVYLPTWEDYLGHSSASWRRFLRNAALEHDLFFVDLVDEFRNLPPQMLEQMFIAPGAIEFLESAGHYTEEGNEYIAEALYEKLLAIPEIAERLK